MLRTLDFEKLSKDSSLEESGASYNQKIGFRDNHGEDI